MNSTNKTATAPTPLETTFPRVALVMKGDGKIFHDHREFMDNKQLRGSPTVLRDRFFLQKKPQGRFLLSVHKGLMFSPREKEAQ